MPVINCCPYTCTTCLNQTELKIQYDFVFTSNLKHFAMVLVVLY